ncbi:hypothetical protein DPMN_051081 [Dreissena polymorpha]|uniref:Uncharacterized protein n=1 Tax=Dreissena polymorpha TaxID=45954 RepID=A0A9D4HNK9_DREPO|nr:hypothetical protein DPMN_051081 [Dreissena polymorpha]
MADSESESSNNLNMPRCIGSKVVHLYGVDISRDEKENKRKKRKESLNNSRTRAAKAQKVHT